MGKRNYRVIVTRQIEYSATTWIWARSQAEADRKALDAYYKWHGDSEFPPSFHEHAPADDGEVGIDTRVRCVDCGEDKDEYYMVADELWAASGMAPNGGMLCLAHLERRIGRLLVIGDFTACCPSLAAWQRHLAAREMDGLSPDDVSCRHVKRPRQLPLEMD
jgi:hypothetical protein